MTFLRATEKVAGLGTRLNLYYILDTYHVAMKMAGLKTPEKMSSLQKLGGCMTDLVCSASDDPRQDSWVMVRLEVEVPTHVCPVMEHRRTYATVESLHLGIKDGDSAINFLLVVMLGRWCSWTCRHCCSLPFHSTKTPSTGEDPWKETFGSPLSFIVKAT